MTKSYIRSFYFLKNKLIYM